MEFLHQSHKVLRHYSTTQVCEKTCDELPKIARGQVRLQEIIEADRDN